MPWGSILVCFSGFSLLYIAARKIRLVPAHARSLLTNALSSLALLWVWNLVLSGYGMAVTFNTAVFAAGALLGIPGIALCGVLQKIL